MQQEAYLGRLVLIELQDKTWISGNLIRGSRIPQNGKSKLAHFLFVVGSYFQHPIKKAVLQAEFDTRKLNLQTDKRGHFSTILDGPLPSDYHFFYREKPLGTSEDYPRIFPLIDKEFEVISDLDDTILLSHTASVFKRIRNILFQIPQKKKTILYTYRLMQAFKELNWRVHYLSKSESNLYQIIADFIKFQQLPLGALLLSSHLRWNQLLKPNKGKDYKLLQMQKLLQNLPEKKFILLGDDSQRDMEIYTQVIREFKEQISMVFIRQTRFNRTEKQHEMWADLEKTGVKAYYFDDQDDPNFAVDQIRTL